MFALVIPYPGISRSGQRYLQGTAVNRLDLQQISRLITQHIVVILNLDPVAFSEAKAVITSQVCQRNCGCSVSGRDGAYDRKDDRTVFTRPFEGGCVGFGRLIGGTRRGRSRATGVRRCPSAPRFVNFYAVKLIFGAVLVAGRR